MLFGRTNVPRQVRGSVTLCLADLVTVLEGPLAPFNTNHNALSSFSFVALNSVRSDSIAFWLEFKDQECSMSSFRFCDLELNYMIDSFSDLSSMV